MSVEVKTSLSTTDARILTFSRNIPKESTDVDSVSVSIAEFSGTKMSCVVNPLELITALKTLFPELLINLNQ